RWANRSTRLGTSATIESWSTPGIEHGDLGRHVRLQLSRMEGKFLSGEDRRREHAAVLRAALSDGRDQLHVLSDAQPEDAAELGSANAAVLQADAQGAEAHHARCALEG